MYVNAVKDNVSRKLMEPKCLRTKVREDLPSEATEVDIQNLNYGNLIPVDSGYIHLQWYLS